MLKQANIISKALLRGGILGALPRSWDKIRPKSSCCRPSISLRDEGTIIKGPRRTSSLQTPSLGTPQCITQDTGCWCKWRAKETRFKAVGKQTVKLPAGKLCSLVNVMHFCFLYARINVSDSNDFTSSTLNQ